VYPPYSGQPPSRISARAAKIEAKNRRVKEANLKSMMDSRMGKTKPPFMITNVSEAKRQIQTKGFLRRDVCDGSSPSWGLGRHKKGLTHLSNRENYAW